MSSAIPSDTAHLTSTDNHAHHIRTTVDLGLVRSRAGHSPLGRDFHASLSDSATAYVIESMNVNSRRLMLYGEHGTKRPYFDRVVFVNQHEIALREYEDGLHECLVNGWIYAADGADGEITASEAFEELTGLWIADWDRAYRRMYWMGNPRGAGWMDATRSWFLTYHR